MEADILKQKNEYEHYDLKYIIDFHIQIGPDAVWPRRVDALDAAKIAESKGITAIVLKNKQYIAAPLAKLAEKLVPGIRVFGAFV